MTSDLRPRSPPTERSAAGRRGGDPGGRGRRAQAPGTRRRPLPQRRPAGPDPARPAPARRGTGPRRWPSGGWPTAVTATWSSTTPPPESRPPYSSPDWAGSAAGSRSWSSRRPGGGVVPDARARRISNDEMQALQLTALREEAPEVDARSGLITRLVATQRRLRDTTPSRCFGAADPGGELGSMCALFLDDDVGGPASGHRRGGGNARRASPPGSRWAVISGGRCLRRGGAPR